MRRWEKMFGSDTKKRHRERERQGKSRTEKERERLGKATC